jgi:thermitase
MVSDDAPDYADYYRELIVYREPGWSDDTGEEPAEPEGGQPELQEEQPDGRGEDDASRPGVLHLLRAFDPVVIDRFDLGPTQVELIHLRNRALPVGDAYDIARRERSDLTVLRNTPIALLQGPVNDPLYRWQWALDKIDAAPAWQRFRQAAVNTVRVAIVDSGVQRNHPDLQAVSITGQNFVPGGAGFSDDDGHGTMLAGTLAAPGDNALGIAGVVPGAPPRLSLMALKFNDIRTPPLAYSAAKAIAFAAGGKTGPRRADIINASWHLLDDHRLVRDALRLARRRRVLVVTAAGNEGSDNARIPVLPADYAFSNMISVMASDRRDDKPWFSNYGSNVDIAAPGVRILSTGLYFRTPAYREYSGTSPSAVQVSAAAAMLLAIDNSWSPSEIREHLVASADPVRNLRGLCRANGRLNLRRAVVGPLSVVAPAGGERLRRGSTYEVRWAAEYDTPAVTSVAISVGNNLLATANPENGRCQVTLPSQPIGGAVIRIKSMQKNLYADSRAFDII